MKKFVLSLVLLAALLLGTGLCPRALAEPAEPGVSARSAILISGDDGSVWYEKNAREPLAMASTTKIMTALLTLEEAERSGDPALDVTGEMVAVEGSSMGLQAGDRLSLRNLAAGMLLASGNDAANAAALYLSGSQEEFARKMNARAREIGMEDTNFVTPSGLDDEQHYSTAYDMALLAREALKNPDFAQIAASPTRKVEFLDPPKLVNYSNHNKLLRIYEGCIGVKTGFTKKAGRCLVSAARREGTTLIAVTLNAPDDWNDHALMLDYGFGKVKSVHIDGEDLPESVPVAGSGVEEAALGLEETRSVTLPLEDARRVERQVLLPRFVYAPVERGQEIGRVRYLLDGEELLSAPITAQSVAPVWKIPRSTPWERFLNGLNNLLDRVTG